jgi:hypothetical protein
VTQDSRTIRLDWILYSHGRFGPSEGVATVVEGRERRHTLGDKQGSVTGSRSASVMLELSSLSELARTSRRDSRRAEHFPRGDSDPSLSRHTGRVCHSVSHFPRVAQR